MKLLADKDERFKGLLVKTSIFVLLAVIGLSLNLLFSGIKKGFFTPKSVIFFIASTGQDIKVGMPVKLSGFKIGTVSKLELDSKAEAQVEMMIENRYLTLLKEDALVRLNKEGLIGDSTLEVNRGSETTRPLMAGATIKFERSGGLDQIADDLRDRLYPALEEINKLLKDVNDPKGDVRQTLVNLRQFAAEIRGTPARINHLLGQIDESVVNDVRPMLHSMKQSAVTTEATIEKFNQQVPGMIKKVDASLDNLHHTSETLKSTVDSLAPNLTGILGETRGLMSDTRNIMDAASTSWPLKNIMPASEQGLVKVDSHD